MDFCAVIKEKQKRKPDGSSGVDLCHHLLSPANISVVSHFPQGVVLHNIALTKGGAGATFVEGLALCREGHRTCTVQTQAVSSDCDCYFVH